jgi:hypothetical protein
MTDDEDEMWGDDGHFPTAAQRRRNPSLGGRTGGGAMNAEIVDFKAKKFRVDPETMKLIESIKTLTRWLTEIGPAVPPEVRVALRVAIWPALAERVVASGAAEHEVRALLSWGGPRARAAQHRRTEND